MSLTYGRANVDLAVVRCLYYQIGKNNFPMLFSFLHHAITLKKYCLSFSVIISLGRTYKRHPILLPL